jgi:hypothetical protein
MPTSIDKIVMAIWFILFGVLTAPFLQLSFAYGSDVLAVLASSPGRPSFAARAMSRDRLARQVER